MGVVSKSGVKFTIILYVGIVLGYVNTIIVFPNILSEEQFGLTRILASASAVIAQFAILGGDNVIIRFSPYFKDFKKNVILSIGLVLSLLGLTIIGIAIFIFREHFLEMYSEKSSLFVEYSYLLVPYVIALVFFNLFDAYLRVIFKNVFVVFLNFIVLRIAWLAIVILYYFEWIDITAFLFLYVGAQIFITIICAGYLLYLKKFNLSFNLKTLMVDNASTIGWFGVFTIASGISFYLINRLDILMVGKYIGLDEVAIYAIAFNMSTVILVPSQAISRTVSVLLADAAKRNDIESLILLYKKTALNQLILGSVVFVLIAINYNLIIQFLPPSYKDSFYIFLFLGGAKVIDTAFGMNGPIILNSSFFRVDTILSCVLLALTFVSNMYLIPMYGVEGAAFATAFSITVFNLLKYAFLKIKMNLSPFDLNYLKGIIIIIAVVGIALAIPKTQSIWIDSFIKSTILVFLFVGLIFFSKISVEINQLILSFFHRVGFSKKK
ncbi:lipopolysaccharide biosynthesis protein [Fulvivirga ligni]|uniref:lipopolysaccharide biosynthesis protein n=1 Tax=Fulvivirga ligni TaxID=2904246 RepID=UPI001F287FF1|nr:polysaccharide biosynthesis C-terminal domain-containing protein [Fulvivirga ligni]UII23673.1 polysaccharide biosynthesis C-terminal domain-containing protein [Fulvivirga ligni]